MGKGRVVGVLQRFERRLEHLVEGTFAKVFKGEVQPVEIAQALQRETDDKKAVVSQGRVLVPNDFVVELGPRDYERLSEYADPLGQELSAMVREHAAEQAYSFVGSVHVAFEQVEELDTGTFRVRSGVAAGGKAEGGVSVAGGQYPASSDQAAAPPPPDALPGHPRLVLSHGEKRDRASVGGRGMDETYFLTKPTVALGRGPDADVRLDDPKVSRRHALLRFQDGAWLVEDAGSTNGTVVNGVPYGRRELAPGDRIELGETTLIFDRDPDG